jgi:hypothetical protein
MALVLDNISRKRLSRKLWNHFRSRVLCISSPPGMVKPICMALRTQLKAHSRSDFRLYILEFGSGARPRMSLALLHQSSVNPKLVEV